MHFLLRVLAFVRSLVSSITLWLVYGLLDILATGPIPGHVAFVMNGNRRYAKRLGKEGKEGHPVGFKTMQHVVEVCARLRIRCVTVYAFAINNFNRPKDELDVIMGLLEHDLVQMAQPGNTFDRYGARLNVLGRRDLFWESVRAAIEVAENLTRHHDTIIFNLCAPYESQDEITTAVEGVIREALEKGDLDGSTITEESISSHLSTSLAGSPPLDILVRTSGTTRLSGFLTWQCCEDTQIHVVDIFWPAFGLFEFVPIILQYQRRVWAVAKKNPRLQGVD